MSSRPEDLLKGGQWTLEVHRAAEQNASAVELISSNLSPKMAEPRPCLEYDSHGQIGGKVILKTAKLPFSSRGQQTSPEKHQIISILVLWATLLQLLSSAIITQKQPQISIHERTWLCSNKV